MSGHKEERKYVSNKANRSVPSRCNFSVCGSFFNNEMVDAFSDQIIQKGATGDDVVELQSRLQYVGYYNGKIDGVFGWGTYWAVRHYQYEYGLEIDGLVGDDMKAKLASTTDYDKAFVTKALNEGRKFSHYGGTPKDIQKGPKGSADKQGKQKKKQEKVARHSSQLRISLKLEMNKNPLLKKQTMCLQAIHQMIFN